MKTEETNANNDTNHLAKIHSGEVDSEKEEVKKEEFETKDLDKDHEQSVDEVSAEPMETKED